MGLNVNPRFNEILADALEAQKAEQEAEQFAESSKKDTISRQAAINALWDALYAYEGKIDKQFQESEDLDVCEWLVHREFVQNMSDIDRKTILELPSAQSEQTDCEFCHEDSDGFIRPIEKNSHALVSFGLDGWHIAMRANGWVGRAPIKFCPMCGRRLTNE